MGDDTYTMFASNVELLEQTVRLLRKAGTALAGAREGVRPFDPWTGDGPERVRLHDHLGAAMATLAEVRADLSAIAASHTGRRERREAALVRTTWAERHAEVQAAARGEDEVEG
jgi:hypothetical protein